MSLIAVTHLYDTDTISRAIHDFESLVTPDQYARLKNFLYITSKEELAEFDKFVRGLGIKKIQGLHSLQGDVSS